MRQIDRTLVNHPYNLLNLTAEQMAHLTNHKNIRSAIYAHENVKQALKSIYHEKCYICECYVGDNYAVEHYLPKQYFSHLGYTWDNLHKVCDQCNLAKESDQFFIKDQSDNIVDILLLDPSNPSYNISDYLSFNLDGEAILVSYGVDQSIRRKAEHTVNYLNGNLRKAQGKPFEHASKLNHLRSSRIGAFERFLRETNLMIYRQNILSINSTISTYQAQNNTEKQQLDLDTYHFLANLFKNFLNDECVYCSTLRDYCFTVFRIKFKNLKIILEHLRNIYRLP
ncbi:hypothetical protein Q5X66_15525, partial [Acinetobacter baumannii]|nr:hypothetical protein [Acinetobacter baumannii]